MAVTPNVASQLLASRGPVHVQVAPISNWRARNGSGSTCSESDTEVSQCDPSDLHHQGIWEHDVFGSDVAQVNVYALGVTKGVLRDKEARLTPRIDRHETYSRVR